jgi:hypothetical protein
MTQVRFLHGDLEILSTGNLTKGIVMIKRPLPIFTPTLRTIPQATKDAYHQIYFRQSFIQDYLLCPYMAVSRWLGNAEEKASPMAAFLGTAGHEVIYRIHKERRYDIDELWLTEAFETGFRNAIKREPNRVPQPKAGFATIEDQLFDEMPFYISLLKMYQRHPNNKEFFSVIHEQSFVLEIGNPIEGKPPYLMTGTIDQAGYTEKGDFILRDIKFRDNHFKYSRRQLDLNIQITMYAAALKFGKPACDNCKPEYVDSTSPTGEIIRTLHYSGPCETCEKKIGTKWWPNILPVRCEMVWMYDLEPRSKDEFPQFLKRPALPKVRNPKTNRMVQAETVNPEWESGAKAGDPKGECFLRTFRTSAQIQVFMDDILRVCNQIRDGIFFRLPSKACDFCTQYESCRAGVVAEAAVQGEKNAAMYVSSDPFGGV